MSSGVHFDLGFYLLLIWLCYSSAVEGTERMTALTFWKQVLGSMIGQAVVAVPLGALFCWLWARERSARIAADNALHEVMHSIMRTISVVTPKAALAHLGDRTVAEGTAVIQQLRQRLMTEEDPVQRAKIEAMAQTMSETIGKIAELRPIVAGEQRKADS